MTYVGARAVTHQAREAEVELGREALGLATPTWQLRHEGRLLEPNLGPETPEICPVFRKGQLPAIDSCNQRTTPSEGADLRNSAVLDVRAWAPALESAFRPCRIAPTLGLKDATSRCFGIHVRSRKRFPDK
jgi:hypothetical protein